MEPNEIGEREKKLIRIISSHSPFPYGDLAYAYCHVKSIDDLMIAIEFACRSNLGVQTCASIISEALR